MCLSKMYTATNRQGPLLSVNDSIGSPNTQRGFADKPNKSPSDRVVTMYCKFQQHKTYQRGTEA